MKQQELEKKLGKLRIFIGLMICLISTVIIGGVMADSISDASAISGSSQPSDYNPFYPNDFPYPSSVTEFGSSTSYTTSPSSSGDSTTTANVVITESMIPLIKNQSAIYMINFQNAGTLEATSLSGNGFELYAKQGTIYPQNVTSKLELGSLSTVTSSSPLSLDIAEGSWYFTILPIGEISKFDIKAIQKGKTTSSTSSTQSTHSSSLASKSLGFR
jgi:hypothetical protein